MADYYVSSVDGDTGSPGTSWTDAKSTINEGMALMTAAGDVLYVDSAHTQTGGAITFSTNGTDANPLIMMSWDRTGGVYKPGADVSYATASTITGHFRWYGIDLTATGANNLQFATDSTCRFFDCTWGMDSTGTVRTCKIGNSDTLVEFTNCDLTFANVAQELQIQSSTIARFQGCRIAGSAINDFLHLGATQYGSRVEVLDCDLSGMAASGAELVGQMPTTVKDQNSQVLFSNCLLSAGAVVTSTSIVTKSTLIEAYNCSSKTVNQRDSYYVATINGNVQDDHNTYLDTTNTFSLEMTTSGTSQEIHEPIKAMLGEVYAAAGATIGIRGLIDRASILQDDEFWIEVSYVPITSGENSRHLIATTLMGHNDISSAAAGYPDLTKTPSNLATDTSTWVKTAITNETRFKAEIDLSTTTVTSDDGIVQVWVYLAGASITEVFIDSKIVVT